MPPIQREIFVLFRVGGIRLAVTLSTVTRVVRAVEVTPIPSAPLTLLGVIDVAGKVLPVLDIREKLQLPARPVKPSDHFVIAHASQRDVVLAVDEVEGVTQLASQEIVPPPTEMAGNQSLKGVARIADELVVIQNLESFLSPLETHSIDATAQTKTRDGS